MKLRRLISSTADALRMRPRAVFVEPTHWDEVVSWSQSPFKPILPRKRRLTQDIQQEYKRDQQSQSMLFSKLPLEVRRIIFAYAVTGKLVHIEDGAPVSGTTQASRRVYKPSDVYHLLHLHCHEGRLDLPWDHDHSCQLGMDSSRPKVPEDFLLSLPLTCKSIYADTIRNIYQLTIFCFTRVHLFLSLPRFILCSRLHQISNIVLFCDLIYESARNSETKAICDSMWAMLRSLESLRELRLRMEAPTVSQASWEINEATTAGPAGILDHLDCFEFIVPAWPTWISDTIDWGTCCAHSVKDHESIQFSDKACQTLVKAETLTAPSA